MLWRRGLHLARHAVQPFGEQRAQRPARAVAAEHVQIVNVNVALAVRLADVGRIHMREPVIGRDLARHVQDEAAQRIALVGVGVHPPVGAREVFVDGALHVHQRLRVGPQRGAALAVGHVGARGGHVARGNERLLHHVLNLLDVRRAARPAVGQHAARLIGQERGLRIAELARGRARAGNGRADAAGVKNSALAVALDDGSGHGRRGSAGCRRGHGSDLPEKR